MKRVVASILAALLMVTLLSACGVRDSDVQDDGAAVSDEAAPSGASSETSADATGTGDASASEDASFDADAIQRELEAIQDELDDAALPDDSDFSEIEGGL